MCKDTEMAKFNEESNYAVALNEKRPGSVVRIDLELQDSNQRNHDKNWQHAKKKQHPGTNFFLIECTIFCEQPT